MTPGRALGGHSDAPIVENGQPPCIFPSEPYVIRAELKSAIARNDSKTSCVEIFLRENIIPLYYNVFALRRSELPTTETLENAIAAPAKIGFSRIPKNG